jgi:LPXTG-motif cell wall-anchored protein
MLTLAQHNSTSQEGTMNTMKIVGIVAGLAVVALLGGGGWWLYRKKKQKDSSDAQPEPVTPSKRPRPVPNTEDVRPRSHFVGTADLGDALRTMLDENPAFRDSIPPEDAVVDNMTQEDLIVFAVESEPVGNYTETRQELISGKVLSVEKTHVRARVQAPVAHAEHHGSHAGHGIRVGDLVEVPRSKVLLAARSTAPKRTGYDSQGEAEATFKSSHVTKTTYRVRPSTPYDLELPYRTNELEWVIDGEHVTMSKVGEKGLIEQIMFSEDSMRGPVKVTLLDNDPKEGAVFVGRWDFTIDP